MLKLQQSNWYAVGCNSCNTRFTFPMLNTTSRYMQCPACKGFVDLADGSVSLSVPPDANKMPPPELVSETVIEPCDPPPAHVQLAALYDHMQLESNQVTPQQAYQNFQTQWNNMMKKHQFFKKCGDAVELLVCGRPTNKVGNVKLFEKERCISCCQRSTTSLSPNSSFCTLPLMLTVSLVVSIRLILYYGQVQHNTWISFGFTLIYIGTLSALVCLLLTALINPGYLRPVPGAKDPHKQVINGMYEVDDLSRSVVTIVRGVRVEQRWCNECGILRPMRAAHCYICGLCVEEFDHHCNITGACIGKRNLKFFILFLFSLTLASTSGTILAVYSLVNDTYENTLVWMVAILTTFAVAGVAVGLYMMTCGALQNIHQGKTLRERLKHIYGKSPFNDGIIRNCMHVCALYEPPEDLCQDKSLV